MLGGSSPQYDDFRCEIGQKTEVFHLEFEKTAGSPGGDDPLREYDTVLPVDGATDSDFPLAIALNEVTSAGIVEYEFHALTIPYSNPGKKSVSISTTNLYVSTH